MASASPAYAGTGSKTTRGNSDAARKRMLGAFIAIMDWPNRSTAVNFLFDWLGLLRSKAERGDRGLDYPTATGEGHP